MGLPGKKILIGASSSTKKLHLTARFMVDQTDLRQIDQIY